MDLRAVLVLHDLDEQTMAEIAALLDIPTGTVALRLRRARRLFLDKLSLLTTAAASDRKNGA